MLYILPFFIWMQCIYFNIKTFKTSRFAACEYSKLDCHGGASGMKKPITCARVVKAEFLLLDNRVGHCVLSFKIFFADILL